MKYFFANKTNIFLSILLLLILGIGGYVIFGDDLKFSKEVIAIDYSDYTKEDIEIWCNQNKLEVSFIYEFSEEYPEGKVIFNGKELHIHSPKDAIDNGIALITEDRRGTGIFGVLSVSDNVAIASISDYLKSGFLLDHKAIKEVVDKSISELSIKTPSNNTQIKSLSGGNQQKVIISRWLAKEPDVLIMDEPTRGIDVGAKYEIYAIIGELAKRGKTIIVVSSEMPELIGICDRIMVMCEGRITGVVEGKDMNQEKIMELSTKFMS